MERREAILFVAYFIFFAVFGAFFILYFPLVLSFSLGEDVICTAVSARGLFCYNIVPGQTLYGDSLQVNWMATIITWTIDLVFLFSGAFLALKSYTEQLQKRG